MTSPAPPLDAAAAEAANRVLDFCDGTARHRNNNDETHVARIITEAYAEQRGQTPELLFTAGSLRSAAQAGWDSCRGASEAAVMVCKRVAMAQWSGEIDARLTAERQVREKLVEALGKHSCRCSYMLPRGARKTGICPRCSALAAAKKLEDADAD